MLDNISKQFGFDKLLQLIPVNGELTAAAKRSYKRYKARDMVRIAAEYAHRQALMELLARDSARRAQIRDIFSHFPDIGIVHLERGQSLAVHELFELKSFLYYYGRLCQFCVDTGFGNLHPLPDLSALFSRLDPEGNALPVFRLSPRFSAKLQQLLDKQDRLVLKLKEIRHQDLENAKTTLGYPTLKEEFVLSRQQQDILDKLLSSRYFVVSSENLANYSFRLADSTAALKAKQQLEALKADLQTEEQAILETLTEYIRTFISELEIARSSAMELAWDFALAEFGLQYNCCIPSVYAAGESFAGIKIEAGINLPLQLYLAQHQRSFKALDVSFDHRAVLITGPNMGGKSTALQTIGLFCTCAAWAIPVPAKYAVLPIYDHIYYNHDRQESSETLSSFGREVVSFSQAVAEKGAKLFLLDEFGKGTNPAEGEAICLATLKYLIAMDCTTIAATHFSAPARLKTVIHYTIKGIDDEGFQRLAALPDKDLNQRLKLLSELMDYSLVRLADGQEPPKCAARIAAILGMPEGVFRHLK